MQSVKRTSFGILLTTAALCAGISAVAQELPLDPQLRTGKLSNGFTYYIRHNAEPAKRVQLYLVNKVGSILEDDDQQGLAHFMEHMNFNGTTHFPKNQLVDYLQRSGVRFGADLNATTSQDETIYQLPLPTDKPGMLETGLRIMRDWAQEATLDSAEIEKERGIIIEEERLGKGVRDRMSRQYLPLLLNNSRYASRIPIGIDSILLNFKPAAIRRFHHDWYRPNLQALIVVGDIDVNQVEQLIRSSFSSLKNPKNERPRTRYTVPLNGEDHFKIVTDHEQAVTLIELLIKHPATSVKTAAGYREAVKRTLFNQLLADRKFTEFSGLADPPFLNVEAGIQPLMAGMEAFAFDVVPRDGRLQEAFILAWKLIASIKRDGFTQEELDRARIGYLRGMEQAFQERDKIPSINYVQEYQRHFLEGEAAPGITWEHQFVKEQLPKISLAEINALANEWITTSNRDILVLAPDKEKDKLPDEKQLLAWINTAENSTGSNHSEQHNATSLADLIVPATAKVIKRETIPTLKLTRVTLDNGVNILLKPTAFKNNEILFQGFKPGGASLYDGADYDMALNAAGFFNSFGVGDLSPIELSHQLTGKIGAAASYIANRNQGIAGSATPADLETFLKLIYLKLTAPRKDTILFHTLTSNMTARLATRYADPINVFSDTMSYFMAGYNHRAAPFTAERLAAMNLDRMYELYKESLSSATGYTFVWVGNFSVDSILPLLTKYLGALPSSGNMPQARDLSMNPPAGIWNKEVHKGREDKAFVRMVVSDTYDYNPRHNIELEALGQVLQMKLIDHIREQEGEVYSPSVQMNMNKYPEARFQLTISFGCAPKNVKHLVTLVQGDIDSLGLSGITASYLQKFKAAYQKTMELALHENRYWLSYLSAQQENGERPEEVLSRGERLNKLTVPSLQAAAKGFFTGKNSIRFVLLPEDEL